MDRKIVVLGMGKSGQAAYLFLKKKGFSPLGLEENPIFYQELILKGFDVVSAIDWNVCDTLIVSPGISPKNKWYQEAKEKDKEIIGEAELALRETFLPVIGVTGTNGKTTVTLLIEHVLNSCGKKAKAVGNVGFALTDYFANKQEDEILVLELSSYQLETLFSKCIKVGLLLNITPDHLDRYASMQEYAEAKFQMQNCIVPEGKMYVNTQVLKDYSNLVHIVKGCYTFGVDSSAFLWSDKKIVKRADREEFFLPSTYCLLGAHETENVLAAWAACFEFGVKEEEFLKALDSFEKPKHRIEFVADIEDVTYINDSKGTNIDATIKAVESMQKPVILIAGGVDKGASYDSWKRSFLGKVKYIIVIGEAAEKIQKTLSPEFSVMLASSLQQAVIFAKKIAQRGDVVLLSPGCSSFDMFRDYADRGDSFKRFCKEISV